MSGRRGCTTRMSEKRRWARLQGKVQLPCKHKQQWSEEGELWCNTRTTLCFKTKLNGSDNVHIVWHQRQPQIRHCYRQYSSDTHHHNSHSVDRVAILFSTVSVIINKIRQYSTVSFNSNLVHSAVAGRPFGLTD